MPGASAGLSTAVSWYKALTHNDDHARNSLSGPVRAVHRLVLILISPIRHRQVSRWFRNHRLDAVVARQPQLPFKYLRRNYLASNLDRRQRARILLFHFDYLASSFPRPAIHAVAFGGRSLWHRQTSANVHRIRLAVPYPVDNEGELALEYLFDGQLIYILSFTFAPPSLFALPGRAVVLISRIQANGADGSTLREVAKNNAGIAPRFALIFALQGFLAALEQTHVVAVNRANQTVSTLHPHAISPASYDELFVSLGGFLRGDGFYQLALPFAEAQPAHASSSHRRRARHRRASRQLVTDQVRQAAADLIARVGPPQAPETVSGALESSTDALV